MVKNIYGPEDGSGSKHSVRKSNGSPSNGSSPDAGSDGGSQYTPPFDLASLVDINFSSETGRKCRDSISQKIFETNNRLCGAIDELSSIVRVEQFEAYKKAIRTSNIPANQDINPREHYTLRDRIAIFFNKGKRREIDKRIEIEQDISAKLDNRAVVELIRNTFTRLMDNCKDMLRDGENELLRLHGERFNYLTQAKEMDSYEKTLNDQVKKCNMDAGKFRKNEDPRYKDVERESMQMKSDIEKMRSNKRFYLSFIDTVETKMEAVRENIGFLKPLKYMHLKILGYAHHLLELYDSYTFNISKCLPNETLVNNIDKLNDVKKVLRKKEGTMIDGKKMITQYINGGVKYAAGADYRRITEESVEKWNKDLDDDFNALMDSEQEKR